EHDAHPAAAELAHDAIAFDPSVERLRRRGREHRTHPILELEISANLLERRRAFRAARDMARDFRLFRSRRTARRESLEKNNVGTVRAALRHSANVSPLAEKLSQRTFLLS